MVKSSSLERPKNERKSWWMYPDVFSVAFTEEAYHKHWKRLQCSDDITITEMLPRPVKNKSWIFKYLGFSRKIETADELVKIQMALQKLLYFGYLNGFNNPEKIDFSMKLMAKYKLSQTFLTECQNTRNNDSSAYLQNELITFYKNHSVTLMNLNSPPEIDYFGESYLIIDESSKYAVSSTLNACLNSNNPTQLFDDTDREIKTFIQLDPQAPSPDVARYICIHDTHPGTALRKLLDSSLSFFPRSPQIWEEDIAQCKPGV